MVVELALSFAAACLAAKEVPGFFDADINDEKTLVAGFDGATIDALTFSGATLDTPLAAELDVLRFATAAASRRLRSAAWRASGFDACTTGLEVGTTVRFVAGRAATSVSRDRLIPATVPAGCGLTFRTEFVVPLTDAGEYGPSNFTLNVLAFVAAAALSSMICARSLGSVLAFLVSLTRIFVIFAVSSISWSTVLNLVTSYVQMLAIILTMILQYLRSKLP